MPAFRKAFLLFNPISGTRLNRRHQVVQRVAEVFRRAGVEVATEATEARGSGGEQARAAIAAGFDAVFACGGDGTALDVLQGVAKTSAVMGVIPFGTGNILAHDLGLKDRPEQAAAQLLGYQPQTISLGRIDSVGTSRYFTVAAGVGVQAELLYQATAGAKQMGGFLTYYTSGARLLLGRPFVRFPVQITLTNGAVVETDALELLALRVRSFGGPLRHWRPGSSLLSPELRLCLLRNESRPYVLGYVLKAMAGMARYDAFDPCPQTQNNAGFCFVSARSVICHSPAVNASKLRVQADGELLGQTPAEISIVPRAVTLFVPSHGEWASPQHSAEHSPLL
jgi:diacylglycerol kinase (ATP)